MAINARDKAVTTNCRSISVVIPNFNGEKLLAENLPFLFTALNNCGCPFEVIVTDDASADGSVAFLEQHYPQVKLLTSPVNGGFATNINRGIFCAVNELAFLLNSDIKLSAHYFTPLLNVFNEPGTFGIMGLVQNEKTKHTEEALKYPSPSVFKVNKFKDVPAHTHGHYIPTYYLSGANALVKRDVLVALGGFNELYSPFYHEDLDLSLRAWEKGFKSYYCSTAVCTHTVSSTIKKHTDNQKVKRISTRNKLLLHYMHLQGWRLILWRLNLPLTYLFNIIKGKSFYKAAFKEFKSLKPQMLNYKNRFISLPVNGRLVYTPLQLVKQSIQQSISIFLK